MAQRNARTISPRNIDHADCDRSSHTNTDRDNSLVAHSDPIQYPRTPTDNDAFAEPIMIMIDQKFLSRRTITLWQLFWPVLCLTGLGLLLAGCDGRWERSLIEDVQVQPAGAAEGAAEDPTPTPTREPVALDPVKTIERRVGPVLEVEPVLEDDRPFVGPS